MNPASPEPIAIRPARPDDAEAVLLLLEPYVRAKLLLRRDVDELRRLMRFGFVAECKQEIVGFSAVEIYSSKLAEVQCLAVDSRYQGHGVGRRLVQQCIQCAHRENVLELMAITSEDAFLRGCGFDYSLPNQKRALFIHTREEHED